jgi:hypothetical protein
MSSAYLTTIPQFQNYSSLESADCEALDAAMRELAQRCLDYSLLRAGLHARLDELKSNRPELRRRRSRSVIIHVPTPVSFYSIEEAISL